MTAKTGETQREFYSKRLAQKQKELAAIDAELAFVRSKVDEMRLNNQAEDFLKDIDELEKKLSGLDIKSDNSNIRHVSLEKTFQKIDFSDARKIAQSINSKFGDSSGAVLFFLQRSTKQKGSYCMDEVLDLIISDRKVGDNIIGDFRPYPVDLGSPISEFNEIEFAKRLASHLNMNPEEPLHSIIKKICSSLRGGSTVFLKIENWDSVLDKENFLDWFIEKFWKSLINELDSIFQEYSKIRFIVTLNAKSKVFPDCLSIPHFCTEDTFDSGKLIELPLPDWTVEDIKQWLITVPGLSKRESQKRASQIHQESEGTPDTICSILERQFKKV